MICQQKLTIWSKSGARRWSRRNGVTFCSRLPVPLATVGDRSAHLAQDGPASFLPCDDRLGRRQGVSMIDLGLWSACSAYSSLRRRVSGVSVFGVAEPRPACVGVGRRAWARGRRQGGCVAPERIAGEPVAAAVTLAWRWFRSSRRPGGTRTCAVHPTWHCANLNLQLSGMAFAVGGVHGKVRRDGYRR